MKNFSKELFLSFYRGDDNAYHDLVELVAQRVRRKTKNGFIYNKIDQCSEENPGQKRSGVYGDLIYSIVAQFEQHLRSKPLEYWASREKKELAKVFYTKVSDCLGALEENENRIKALPKRVITQADWQGVTKAPVDLWRVRRLSYLLYENKKRAKPYFVVEYLMRGEANQRRIVFRANNSEFIRYVTNDEKSTPCTVLMNLQGDTKSHTSPEPNSIKFKKRSKPRISVSIPHHCFEKVDQHTIQLREERIAKESPDDVRKLLEILCGGVATLQMYTTTGFDMGIAYGEPQLSLERFADCFADERLFTDELPGKLLATHAHFPKQMTRLEDVKHEVHGSSQKDEGSHTAARLFEQFKEAGTALLEDEQMQENPALQNLMKTKLQEMIDKLGKK